MQPINSTPRPPAPHATPSPLTPHPNSPPHLPPCPPPGAPKRVLDQVTGIFPGLSAATDLLVIPTCQRSDVDLVTTGEAADAEKDRLLERFAEWAVALCGRLSSAGYWCDYIDPCSGLPMMHKEGQTPYSEVEGLTVLLGYRTANAGCCKVVLHPKWGTSVYPATVFARAPAAAVEAAIRAVEAQLKA
jgi:hypothetical protein